MRIAIVAPGHGADPGGVERHVTSLAEALAAKPDCTVEVWAMNRRRSPVPADQAGGVPVRRFPTSRSRRFPVSLRLLDHVRRQARAFDVLHVHSYHATTGLAALAAPTGVPVVFTPHYHGRGHTPLANALHVPYRPVGRRVFGRSDAVVAVSQAERTAILADHPAVADRIHVVHNGVDARIADAEPFPASLPVVLTLGRLERYKGVDIVLAAFDRLPTEARLVVIGDGADRQRLEALRLSALRLADIDVAGHLPDAEVARWLRTAQVVVSMSAREAFGIVALEGVAGGANVLLSDIPAHREVAALAPDRIHLVDRARPDLVAQRLGDLLAAVRRPPALVATWPRAADALVEVYAEAISRRRARTADPRTARQ